MAQDSDDRESGLWHRPNARWTLGIPLGGLLAFVLGAAGLGGFNWVLHQTSTNEFCYVCHSHAAFIQPEYEASTHFQNASGVRADCADCHLPHDWFPLVWTKAVVSLDIIPEVMGKLDTAEKYEAHRGEMAERVWAQFKANDSAFCRDCHVPEAMNLSVQGAAAGAMHAGIVAGDSARTCIDCHRGLVHSLPAG